MSSNFINGGGNSLSSQSDDDHKIHPTSQPIGADGHEKKASYDLEQGQTLPVVPQYNDDGTPIQTGIAKVEAAQSVWTPKTKWALYIGLGLACYIYSLDGVTTYQFLAYATSFYFKHSLTGTITAAAGIIIAVGKPLMAKLADVFGRAETYAMVTFLYCLGYILIAGSTSLGMLAAGDIIYSFGYTGLQLLTVIVLADITTLRWRGLAQGISTMPFVINTFIGAEVAEGVINGEEGRWRLGYGIFAILVPTALAPVMAALFWSQNKAKKIAYQASGKPDEGPKPLLARVKHALTPSTSFFLLAKRVVTELDVLGLILIAASLALVLLPLGLAKASSQGWKTPSMIAMIVIGVVLFPVFIMYEWKLAPIPLAPARFFKNKTILASCAIGFFDFVSFYLQYTYQYSFVSVIKQEWSPRYLSYFASTQTIALCIFGLTAGIIMAATRRYKWMLLAGLCIRLLGCGLMIHSRGGNGPDAELVMCQVLQGIGGGFAATALQVAAQAGVSHADVASVTALVLLITEVGNSVGSAIATAIWTNIMPGQLAAKVPTNNATLLAEIYGSISVIAELAPNDPVRLGALAAYEETMKRLCIAATCVAVVPIVVCFFFTKDYYLGDYQNAHDGKTLDGKDTGFGEVNGVDATRVARVERQ